MTISGPATDAEPTQSSCKATVWITRAEPGAEATASRLRGRGFEPLVRPLLIVQALPGGDIDLTGVGALAFTSRNGVEAFAARSTSRHLPVFAVGGATATASRMQGFGDVVSADGDIDALIDTIIERAGRIPGEVLYLGPEEAAGDLVVALNVRGVPARRLVVYRTVPYPPDADLWSGIGDVWAVLLHSAKAARVLAEHLAGHPAPLLSAFCLSPAVASSLPGVDPSMIHIAARPEETALLDLLVSARASR